MIQRRSAECNNTGCKVSRLLVESKRLKEALPYEVPPPRAYFFVFDFSSYSVFEKTDKKQGRHQVKDRAQLSLLRDFFGPDTCPGQTLTPSTLVPPGCFASWLRYLFLQYTKYSCEKLTSSDHKILSRFALADRVTVFSLPHLLVGGRLTMQKYSLRCFQTSI